VEALVTLNGSSVLSSARASGGDSRALLRTTVPGYRALKAGVRARIPGVSVLDDYSTLPVMFVRIGSTAELARLKADPAVLGIGANRLNEAFLAQSLPLIGQPTAVAAGHTGAGTAVAVLDSGVDYTRAAFGSCSAPGSPGCKVVVAQDFAPNDGQLDDAILHGTNVAGIVVGVAPDTKILALDVFDGGSAFDSDIVDAINFSIANQSTYNVRAINMSLGSHESYFTSPCGGGSNPYVSAFANARAAGILPVVAAGNDAFANGSFHVGITYPACTPGSVSVGAVYDSNVGGRVWGTGPDQCTDPTTAADQMTCFSQTATFLTVLAPGAIITAASVTQSGTSQASPHVAGAVAVLRDANPGATPTQIQSAIGSSGPLVFDPLIDLSFHRLDLPAAISALGVPPPTTTTTTTTTTTPPPGACTISGNAQPNLLLGTTGDDVICGEGGSDMILPGGGNDVVIGGGGFDWVSLEDATGGATIDLSAGTATAPGMNVSLQEIEGAVGTPFADSIAGNGRFNDLWGLGGSDTIDGRGGFDYARFDASPNRIRADLARGIARGEGSDDLIGIEALVGSKKDDRLLGSNKANFIYGLKGDDLIGGFGKPDTLFGGPGADGLFGGGGNDDLFGGPGADFCDQGPGNGTTSSC
jgi:subtilisin family serine protease